MAGRPKSSFSNEEVQQIEDYALDGCKTGTIATLMDIPYNTLNRHFGKNMHKKRCERKQILLENQNRMSKTNPAMAIFLGKNVLDQTDKQEILQTGEGLSINISEARPKPILKAVKGA